MVIMGAALPGGLSGQVVEGRVWDARSDRTLPNAVVRMVDTEDVVRASTAADSAGFFRLTLPAPGTYRLEADQVGFRGYRSSEMVFTSATETRSWVVEMQPSPIPITGLEVTADQVDRRLRALLGTDPSLLRVRPVRAATIQRFAARGYDLSELLVELQVPSLQVLRTRDGPCYQIRGRGCLPVYLDGARLSRSYPGGLPLEMMGAVVVLLPNELIAYPQGAVHVYTFGLIR